MARIPHKKRIPPSSPAQDREIAAFAAKAPFCYKDPRFCYTLGHWRPHLPPDTVFVVTFRHPLVSARSMSKAANAKQNLSFTIEQALYNYQCTYEYVMKNHLPAGGSWVFVHYDQILDGSAFPRLEEATGATVDRSFPEANLRRTEGREEPIPTSCLPIYEALCAKANYRPA